MKISRVEAFVFLYIVLQGLTMFVQADTVGDAGIWGILDNLYKYNLAQVQGGSLSLISSFWVPAQSAVSILMTLIEVILMYYPAIFHDYYVWVWFSLFFPVAVGFILSIVMSIRGVPST